MRPRPPLLPGPETTTITLPDQQRQQQQPEPLAPPKHHVNLLPARLNPVSGQVSHAVHAPIIGIRDPANPAPLNTRNQPVRDHTLNPGLKAPNATGRNQANSFSARNRSRDAVWLPHRGQATRNGAFIRQGRAAPPLVVHPGAVSRGSAWGPLFLGLILLGGVGWYAVKHYTPQIEQDLTRRSTDALSQAGLADNTAVMVSGRSATLTGSVATSAEREQAENAVANTFGIRAVDNQLAVGGASDSSAKMALSQPTLEISGTGESVTLSGSVSDPRFATALEQSAKDRFGEANVTGSITVDEAVTNPGWLAAVNQLLPETSSIENPGLSIANGTMTLTGKGTAEDKEAIGAKATELLKGHLMVENLIDAPEPVRLLPAFASLTKAGDKITLNGFMSEQNAAAIAEGVTADGDTVINNITTNELAESPQWIERFGGSVTALQDVDNAKLTVTRSGTVKLSGTVSSDENKAAAEENVTAVFGSDVTIANNLIVKLPPVVPTMAPFASVREVDEQVRISGLLSPDTAKSIASAYRAQGKTVIDNIAADERVMTPDWADQLPQSLAMLDGVTDGKINISSAGELTISGTVASENDRQNIEDNAATLFGDSVTLRNDIIVEAPAVVTPAPVVPTMAAFAVVSEADEQVRISGLLPPETAKSIVETYRSQGKTVIDNIAADERVIAPEWAEQIPQSLAALDGVSDRRINISSGGVLTISGLVNNEADRQAAETSATELFGDSVSLRNDIIVETPTIAQAPDLRELFDRIDLAAIRFKSNSADLDADSIVILEQVADALAQVPDASVTIGGHTDSTGNYDYNLNLSAERAERVRRFLANRGTEPDRLTAIGFGPSQPIANNATVTGRALNRRIEFKLSGE